MHVACVQPAAPVNWFLLPVCADDLLAGPDAGKLSTKEILIRGSALAGMVAVPSLSSFLVLWTVLDDLLVAAIIGGIVHFVAMGFSLKISKKFLVRKNPDAGI